MKSASKRLVNDSLDGNLDPLLITKEEPWYKEDATISYGRLIDKSIDERHENPISSRSLFKNQRERKCSLNIQQK